MSIIVQKLEEKTDVASEEYQEWTTNARAGVYGPCSGTIYGLIFADIFGCVGK